MRIDNGIRKRRKKRMRRLAEAARPKQHEVAPPLPKADPRSQDPEYVWKNGGNPWSAEGTAGSTFFTRFKRSLVYAFVLFVCVWGTFQLDTPWAKAAQEWTRDVLSRQLDTMAIAAWYDRHFQGTPSFMPSFFHRHDTSQMAHIAPDEFVSPVEHGTLTVDFATTQNGIRIRSPHEEPVVSLAEGRVMRLIRAQATGYTIMIQHAGGLQSIYSGLDDVQLQQNDWVKGGERLGIVSAASTGEWFFALKKDNRYTDPLEVITLD